MIPNYVYLVVTLILGIVIWIIKNWYSGLEREICVLRDKVSAQELLIYSLKSKLWSEEKLSQHIDRSVRSAMQEVILDWYKDGTIPTLVKKF
jgi:hypothetical protein